MLKHSTRALLLATSLFALAATPAEVRRGGSFGSRGGRTYSAPRAPYGSGGYVAPIQRSMTPRSQTAVGQSYNPGFSATRPRAGGRFGGFGGGLLGGLVTGGLLGHFLGGGGGGDGSGLLATLIQLAILGGIAWIVIGWFRRRSPAPAPMVRDASYGGAPGGFGARLGAPAWAQPTPVSGGNAEISLTPADQDAFERLLVDVQDAFGREDYARLRALTTPEIMSFLSEELSQNATQGLRNQLTNTRLIDAEVSEAWREASGDYATVALRYESIDVMYDRATGAIVRGSNALTPTTELWTFVRAPGAPWKLSAIQEV